MMNILIYLANKSCLLVIQTGLDMNHLTSMCVQPLALAFVMGIHSRLGAESYVRWLSSDLAQTIVDMYVTEKW